MFKKFKPIMYLVFCITLLISLVACSNSTENSSGSDSETKTEEPAVKNLETDVVVVGAGLAGLSAAITAAEEGADVILLEKLAFAGGNSMLSTGIFYIGNTALQKELGIEDSPEAFYDDAMKIADNKRNELQTQLIADHMGETYDWLLTTGLEFSDKLSTVLGSNVARGHQVLPDAPGMIKTLEKRALDIGVDIQYETPATKIMEESGSVIGVKAKNKDGDEFEVKAKNVIIASGGYGADPERLAKYTPSAKGVIYAGSPGTTGEMLDEMIALGANTIDLEEPWLTPTVEINKNLLITSLVLSKGGIMINDEGQRFTNETAPYTDVANIVLDLEQEFVYEVFDNQVKEAVYKVPEYIEQGMVIECESLEKLAEETGLPLEELQATIDDFNSVIRGEKKDEFGRDIYVKELNQAPYYYIKVAPGTIMTPGGVEINENCQVLNKDGEAIKGLYATGESTGGYRAFGYRGGDSLTHATVTGYLAGLHATGK